MKSFVQNVLFVVVLTIVTCISIQSVDAAQASCSYNGYVDGVGDFSVTVSLDDNGKVKVSKPSYKSNCCAPSDSVCKDHTSGDVDKNDTNKLEKKVSISSNIFQKDGDLITRCPTIYSSSVSVQNYTSNWPHIATGVSTTTLYLGDSKSAASSGKTSGETTNEVGFIVKTKVSSVKALTLTSQSIKRGDKVYIEGNVINDQAPLTCQYNTDEGDKMTVKTKGNKVWIDSYSVSSGNSPSIVNFATADSLTDQGCTFDLYSGCGENDNGIYTCTISTSKEWFDKHFINDRELEETKDPTMLFGELSAVDGCAMFQSLNSIIKEIFSFLQIAGIILLIVFGMLDGFKAVTSGEADAIKKAFSKFVKRLFVVILLFILPIMIDWILGWFNLGDSCLEAVK